MKQDSIGPKTHPSIASSATMHQQTVPVQDELEAPPPYTLSTQQESRGIHSTTSSSSSSDAKEGDPLQQSSEHHRNYHGSGPSPARQRSREQSTHDTGYASQAAMSTTAAVAHMPDIPSHEGEQGCCCSTTGGCCFSESGGCFFSSSEGCCFSSNRGCLFSDHEGCCCSDHGGCICSDYEGSCCSPGVRPK